MTRDAIQPASSAAAIAAPAASDQAWRLRTLMERRGEVEVAAARAPARLGPMVAIASGKGGVGKTSLAVNLAIVLARSASPCMLCDVDVGTANADILCGLSPARRIEHALATGRRLAELAVEAPGGFLLVPGTSGGAAARAADPSLPRALDRVREDAALVIADAGAGVGREVLGVVGRADLALVVTTPEPTAITDAYALIKGLRLLETLPRRTALVVNMAASESEAEQVHQRVASASMRFLGVNVSLAGWVPRDGAVGRAVVRRRPLLIDEPRSRAGRAIVTIGASIARLFGFEEDAGRSDGRAGRRRAWLGVWR